MTMLVKYKLAFHPLVIENTYTLFIYIYKYSNTPTVLGFNFVVH